MFALTCRVSEQGINLLLATGRRFEGASGDSFGSRRPVYQVLLKRSPLGPIRPSRVGPREGQFALPCIAVMQQVAATSRSIHATHLDLLNWDRYPRRHQRR